MTQDNNPATPPQGATPGNGPQTPVNPPQGTPPASQPPVTPPAGAVTMSTKEYAQLQRDAARGRSKNRRDEISNRNTPPDDGNNSGLPGDEDLRNANSRADSAESRAFNSELKVGVRDLLEKEEFKNLPASTKALILRNPSAYVSEKKDPELAVLDIEDFVRDEVLKMENGSAPAPSPAPAKNDNPPKNDTPPAGGANTPASISNTAMEDTSKFTGNDKHRAILRNSLRKARMGQ